MSDLTDPGAWVERAEEDYALARLALRQPEPLLYGACFHAQQCAEKYLKGILVFRGVAFARIHDLLLLQEQCARAGILVAIDARKINTLSDYAVRIRYPGDDPSHDEAREALDIASAVRRFAREFLGFSE